MHAFETMGGEAFGVRPEEMIHNYTFERTGCKSETAHKKSREESALLVLGEAPVPAFQLSRYSSGLKL
jgi:hypothetical protein